jgi:phage terminase small subunit
MPALKNPRHERFAQAVVRAVDTAAAYRSAGYDAEGGAAEAGASRLLRNTAVAARIAELQATPATTVTATEVTTTEVTTAQAIREFEEARLLALKKGQAAAAVSATMAKAKLAGLLAEKPENNPERAINFDGNYTDAARRIAFLLRLAADETSNEQQP